MRSGQTSAGCNGAQLPLEQLWGADSQGDRHPPGLGSAREGVCGRNRCPWRGERLCRARPGAPVGVGRSRDRPLLPTPLTVHLVASPWARKALSRPEKFLAHTSPLLGITSPKWGAAGEAHTSLLRNHLLFLRADQGGGGDWRNQGEGSGVPRKIRACQRPLRAGQIRQLLSREKFQKIPWRSRAPF